MDPSAQHQWLPMGPSNQSLGFPVPNTCRCPAPVSPSPQCPEHPSHSPRVPRPMNAPGATSPPSPSAGVPPLTPCVPPGPAWGCPPRTTCCWSTRCSGRRRAPNAPVPGGPPAPCSPRRARQRPPSSTGTPVPPGRGRPEPPCTSTAPTNPECPVPAWSGVLGEWGVGRVGFGVGRGGCSSPTPNVDGDSKL